MSVAWLEFIFKEMKGDACIWFIEHQLKKKKTKHKCMLDRWKMKLQNYYKRIECWNKGCHFSNVVLVLVLVIYARGPEYFSFVIKCMKSSFFSVTTFFLKILVFYFYYRNLSKYFWKSITKSLKYLHSIYS